MANPTIKEGGLLSSHYLEVTFLGVRFNDTGGVSFGPRRISFDKIDCVLLSPASVLSLQFEKEIFAIKVNMAKPKHRDAVQALLDGLARSVA